MLKAVIFDMDGLLIDSEPLWQEAEKMVFKTVGIDLTTEMCHEVMGFRIEEVVQHWYRFKPWTNITLEEVKNNVLFEVAQLIEQKGRSMPGVNYILDFFQTQEFKIGLASASHLILINAVVKKIGVEKYFQVLHSAQFEEYGKPHPAVYIEAAKKLEVHPTECIAFEDSFNGLIAAKAARMKTVAIPEKNMIHQTRFDIADYKLNSLYDFNEKHLEELNKQ